MRALDRRLLLTSGAAAAVMAASGIGAHAAPVRGGKLRLGLSGGGSGDRWATSTPYGTFMQVAGVGCAFETLTEVAPDGMLRGELATFWEPLDGGKSWEFVLRKDVLFHDEQPLAVDDVIASLRRHLRSGVRTPASHMLGNVESIRKLGSGRFRIDLGSPDPGFPMKLSDPHLIIHPGVNAEAALARGTGTGLYRFRMFEAGSGFDAVRVEDHWKGGDLGWFDRVQGYLIPSKQDRISALIAGRVDAIDDPGEAARSLIGDGPRFAIRPKAGRNGIAITRTLTHGSHIGTSAPFDDGRIAQRWWFG